MLILIIPGGAQLSSSVGNCDFSGTEPPLDLRPVCNLEFVHCGLVEKKNRALYLSWFNHGGPTKFENTFFQIAKLR